MDYISLIARMGYSKYPTEYVKVGSHTSFYKNSTLSKLLLSPLFSQSLSLEERASKKFKLNFTDTLQIKC